MEKTLRSPIAVGDQTVSTVSLRRAKGFDLEKLDHIDGMGKFAQNVLLAEVVTGLTKDEVRQMDGEDILEIAEAATDFLPGQAPTPTTEASGDPSSPTSPTS